MIIITSCHYGTALTEPQHTKKQENKQTDRDALNKKALFLKVYKINKNTWFITIISDTISIIVINVILTIIVT